MLLGLLEGIPSMLKGEVAMVTYYILILLSFLSINFVGDYVKSSCLYFLESSLVSIYYEITYYCNTLVLWFWTEGHYFDEYYNKGAILLNSFVDLIEYWF
jgi:hypothetical protein